jgi:hypothetical protein
LEIFFLFCSFAVVVVFNLSVLSVLFSQDVGVRVLGVGDIPGGHSTEIKLLVLFWCKLEVIFLLVKWVGGWLSEGLLDGLLPDEFLVFLFFDGIVLGNNIVHGVLNIIRSTSRFQWLC